MSRIVSKMLKNRFLVSLILYMTVSLIVSLIQRKVKGSISETRTFILFFRQDLQDLQDGFIRSFRTSCLRLVFW